MVSACVLFWSVHQFFFLQCDFLFSEQHLFWSFLSFAHTSYSLSPTSCTVAYFLQEFPPCFLSSEPCFGGGQEVVFKLAAFWSLLIWTLRGAFVLRVIWVSPPGENQESKKLENKWAFTMVERKAGNSGNFWLVNWMDLITKLSKEKEKRMPY